LRRFAAPKHAFAQTSLSDAREALTTALRALRETVRVFAELVDAAWEDVLSDMSFPDEHWRQIHSTSPRERLNKEIRRRTDLVGIFPKNPPSSGSSR
jgi:putative transposase